MNTTLGSLMANILMLVALITVPVAALAAFDTTQPVTAATFTGTKGSDGWYTTAVTVTLAATDGADGSGVAMTEYSLDSVTWQTYSTPFVVERDGVQHVYFRSTDFVGNIEAPAKFQEIKINKTGLVGWWRMDGDWKDASVAGNDGTSYNGADFSTNANVGTESGSFTGSNSFVSISDTQTLNPDVAMTITGWININKFDKIWQMVVWKGNKPDCTTGCENRAYALLVNSTGLLTFVSTPKDMVGVGQLGISTAPGSIQAGAWTHFAGVISASSNFMKIYVNGQELASAPYSPYGIRTTSGPLMIGNKPELNNTFNGLIDEVSIYNRALSPTDIQSLYRNYVVKSPSVNPVTSPTTAAGIILSGTKPANTSIVINGNTLVPLDGMTNWQANYTLLPGVNNLTITARNSQNLSSLPVTLMVVLDTTPPAAPTIAPVSMPINTTSKTISGTRSSDSATVVVSCDGAANDMIVYPTTTTWSVNVSGLKEGSNLITVYAVDTVGNQSATTAATIIVDTTQPAVAATPAGGIYQSTQSVVLAANEQGVICYTLDGSTPTATGTRYSQPISIPASATLKYFARDLAGNDSEIKIETYVVDAAPPVLEISTLSNGTYTNNETLNIAGTVMDDTGVAGALVNNTTVPVNVDGSFSYALLLRDGVNGITVAATDSAGNMAADTRTVFLDQAVPVLTVTTPADNSNTANVLLEVSGTVDETSTVTVKKNDIVQSALMNNGAFAATIILEPGYNTIEVTAVDLAGNQSSLKRTVVFDDQVPSLAVTVPSQDIRTNLSSLTIKGTVADTLTAVNVTISTDNEIITLPVVAGTFEHVVNFTEEKTYGIIVTATNEAGTATSVQRNVIYDITPPVLSIDPVSSPTSQRSFSVSGTREAGTTITVACTTATVGEVSYPTATTWLVDISGLAEGENVITAVSVDAAGNAVTANATVVLESRLPAITLMATPNVIWSPNRKMVPVTITGGVDAFGSDIKSVSISVTDEYGMFKYNNLTFGSTVKLEAWRNGKDMDGRKYTITAVVTNKEGIATTRTATVTVPHDMQSIAQ